MFKTNSKKARENIRQYIINHFDATNYGIKNPDTFPEIAAFIWKTFQAEKASCKGFYKNLFEMFEDWTQGLPNLLDTCYYYNRSAVDELGAILEETEEEKKRYTEADAERMITRLIFREVEKAVNK